MPTGESEASAAARSAPAGSASTRHENEMRPGWSSIGSNRRRKMLTELSAFTRSAGRAITSTGSNTTWRLPGKANDCQLNTLGGVVSNRPAAWLKANLLRRAAARITIPVGPLG